MLPSTMLNLFRWALNSPVPRDNPRDSRYKFSLRPLFLNPWSKRDPGKDVVRKPSCFSAFPTFLPFVQHSQFRDWALYTILPEVACIASESALSFPATPTCAGTHMKLTSRPFRASCQHFCLHSYTNGWVCSEIFCDSIALIELILSFKIKSLPSASFSI
jgi:hypothetical protein